MGLSSKLDRWLTTVASRGRQGLTSTGPLPLRRLATPVGAVRAYDSGTTRPCVVLTPDGPNVIEHYKTLIARLEPELRVVCFDMPGFGFSLPEASYAHSLDQGAQAVLGVLDALGIASATLAFSCANGFYALRAARLAPTRIKGLVLAQTPSLQAMHAWTRRIIPAPLRVPVLGQAAAWLLRSKAAHGWYRTALPRNTPPEAMRGQALHALSGGACFCLAGVVQGLLREQQASLNGVAVPCTLVWGEQDFSHRGTDPLSLLSCVPQSEHVSFPDCGHFPDVEQPQRYADLLLERVRRWA